VLPGAVARQRHGRGVLGRAILALERPEQKGNSKINSDTPLKVTEDA